MENIPPLCFSSALCILIFIKFVIVLFSLLSSFQINGLLLRSSGVTENAAFLKRISVSLTAALLQETVSWFLRLET